VPVAVARRLLRAVLRIPGQLAAGVERADGAGGFAVDITGEFTVGRDFERVLRKTSSRARFSSGCRRR
jgi:hypothetical protein